MRRRLTVAAITLLSIFVGLAWLGAAIGVGTASPPTFAAVRAAYRPSDIRLLDRNGEAIHEQRVDKKVRRFDWVELPDVAAPLAAAIIASEDKRFEQHGGVDVRALLAAAADRLSGRSRRGGSTIAMQLAGLLDPTLGSPHGQRSLRQKWRQIWAARALAANWSKAEILEAYLNLVSFRGELQGVGAAAALLFGKLPHGLSAAEARVLAALLKGPNAGSALLARRAAASGGASAELDIAVHRVLSARQRLERVELAPHLARSLLSAGHASLSSTLRAPVQRLALDSLRQNLLALRDRHVADGAVLVVDNATGEVIAYVGGIPDLSSAAHVDAVRARRQAGSTLKPFLYSLALEQRLLTAASLVEDTPLEIGVAGGLYRPQNYDGVYRGLVSVRAALAGSLNVPAVRTLLLVGEDSFVGRLRQLGFGGLSEAGDYYGPSLALGSADVSLWELVNAYRSLANAGRWSSLHALPSTQSEHRGMRAGPLSRMDEACPEPLVIRPYQHVVRQRGRCSGSSERIGWIPKESLFPPAKSGERHVLLSPVVLPRRDNFESCLRVPSPGWEKDRMRGNDGWLRPFTIRGVVDELFYPPHPVPLPSGRGDPLAVPVLDVRAPGGSGPGREKSEDVDQPRDVISPAAAFITADILADRESRSTTFGIENPLATRYWAAVKTGTSKEMRDNWCVGFSRRYTVGVWVGNLNGEPMHDVSGIAGAAPVWREVMDALHEDDGNLPPLPPAHVHAGARHEWFIDGTEAQPLAVKPRAARILTPVTGTTIAVDPDIPESSQRVLFNADGERADLRWHLDGSDLGTAATTIVWHPQPGRHTLSLVDPGGTISDSTNFTVRGVL